MSDNNGRPKASANIYKNGRLKTRKELGLTEEDPITTNERITDSEIEKIRVKIKSLGLMGSDFSFHVEKLIAHYRDSEWLDVDVEMPKNLVEYLSYNLVSKRYHFVTWYNNKHNPGWMTRDREFFRPCAFKKYTPLPEKDDGQS